MKTRITLSLFFLSSLFNHFASAQILTNGGFENWATGPSFYLDPVGWTTNNGANPLPTVLQAPGHTGNYSVNLVTVPDLSTVYLGGNLHLDFSGSVIPLDVSGYWKGTFLPGNTNEIIIEVLTYNTNSLLNGTGVINTPPSTNIPNWTYFNFQMYYTDALPLSSTHIYISLKGDTTTIEGFLDDLVMTYSIPTGEIRTVQLFGSAFTQDITGDYLLNLNLLSTSSFTLSIISADGKMISKKNYQLYKGAHSILVPTQELAEGIYFVPVEISTKFCNEKDGCLPLIPVLSLLSSRGCF